jgi:thiol:disulfide interchange protein DsbD
MDLRIFALIFALFSSHAFAGLFDNQSKSQFVPVDQAFAFDFQQSENQLNLNWQIKPGYYLYRQQIKLNPAQAELAPLDLPKGTWHEDEFYGKTEIYTRQLNLPVTIHTAAKGATVSVTYQGCAEAGFCYPPETRVVPLSEVVAASGTPAPSAITPEEQTAPGNTAPAQLPFSALWAFLIGIGIAFTPCVLPMYPLISGIVLGGKQRLSTARALLLTFIYVQGMALTYTALGLVVAAAGLQFQAALQHPYVLIGLSALFVLLAASMFGLFTLQLPSSLQTRLTLMSNRQQGGSAGGVFAMGALAGLICSPCTTAPLSAILLYIAQSALSLCAWHGLTTDADNCVRQPSATQKRPMDGNRQNCIWFCDPRPACLPAGANPGRQLGDSAVGLARRGVLWLGLYHKPGRPQTMDACGADNPAGCRAGMRPASARLGIWYGGNHQPGTSQFHENYQC